MVRKAGLEDERPLYWIGPSFKALLEFPSEVRTRMGFALSAAQFGGKHVHAKPWKGDGPGVFEIVEDHRGDTFRSIYTVRFAEAVYVLHVFQKKSKSGIKTPKADQDLITTRLRDAQRDYEERYGKDH